MQRLIILLASVALGWAQSSLPPSLADYRSWEKLLKQPQAVPLELWQLCRSPMPKDLKLAAATHGPHNQHYIQVYANRSALGANRNKPFPVGSILAKEKLLLPNSREPDGVAFMIKQAGSKFAGTGGWEFLYFPVSGKTKADNADSQSCAACHSGAANDYVRGEYEIWKGTAPRLKTP